jgi:hypothetical protein
MTTTMEPMEVAGMPRHAQEQARDAKKKVQVTVVFPDPTVFDRLEAEAARKGLAVCTPWSGWSRKSGRARRDGGGRVARNQADGSAVPTAGHVRGSVGQSACVAVTARRRS